MKKSPWLIAAILCYVLAVFFKFALIGYGYMAAMFTGIGTLILLYRLFHKLGKQWMSRVLTGFLCLGMIIFIIAEIPVILHSKGDDDVEADYIIVLGAGVNGSVPSLSMRNRLDKALEYLEAHPDCVAILSGGQGPGEDMTEAQAMYDWLSAKGIAPDRLIMEDKATSTVENIRFSYELMGEDADSATVAVVSAEYHLCRAKYIARELGYEVYGLAGHTTYPVLRLNYFIREAFGMVHHFVFGV